jgi:outer membrane immunogenic protein
MNKIAYVLLGGAALAALAAPASAATVSGGRVEAIVGWDHGSISLDDFGIDDSVNADGILFGIGAGYDFAVSDAASVGIDLEASESTADLEAGDVDDTRISVGRDLYVGGRATFAVSSAANLYVKAGYTNARLKISDDNGFSASENGDGFRGGFGAQFMIGSNAYIGAEYRYSNYEADVSRHQVAGTLGFRF